MSGHILAMGGGGLLSRDSLLEDFLLELSRNDAAEGRLLADGGGERARGDPVRSTTRSASRDCEPSHLELFGMPEEPAARVAAQDVDLRRAAATRRTCSRSGACTASTVALREAWERGAVVGGMERRRELLVRGLRHRLVRPAAARARRRARLPRRVASAPTTTASPSGGRPTRGSSATASSRPATPPTTMPRSTSRAPSCARSSASARARAATASAPTARQPLEPRQL